MHYKQCIQIIIFKQKNMFWSVKRMYILYLYSSPSILQPSILRPPLIIRPKGQFSVLNDLYFKTTCNIRPHVLGPMGGLKIEGPLYMVL